ncbi:hypothetical protein [uncultured Desulfovibrio sp.]|uniref:hypothetical protein n=1 Tax=uncultured Desulfovibrio sp. TaxID=167968 RepID=UPI0026371350|nr:hypothetical protein [uncultured Desulfovibrio sp.]
MSLWTRDELLALLADWKAAYRAASHGKSYTIAGRTLTRQDIGDIRDQLDYLQRQLDSLTRGAGPVRVRAVRER